jgi:large subunit ribosomal protein L4
MTVALKKFDASTQAFSSVDASEGLFNLDSNVDLMHMAAVRQMNNARLGTASTKTRAEVRGGGKKPWKQKGTGRARAGSSRSPLWKGGGTSFGPKPRSFATSLNRKMASKAVASALSTVKERIVVIADSALNNLGKTADANKLMQAMTVAAGQKVVIISDYSDALSRATSNLPLVKVVSPAFIGVVDVLNADHVVIAESALQILERRLLAE